MKTILILRHGKSDWQDTSRADFDRPLAPRGRKDAPLMGKVLARFNQTPGLIISSPARRAAETATLAAAAGGYKSEIQFEPGFYFEGVPAALKTLRRIPDSVERVLLVGHNPTLTDAVATLCWHQPTPKAEDLRLPTAGLVCLEAHITAWQTLSPGDAVLRWFIIPRLIRILYGRDVSRPCAPLNKKFTPKFQLFIKVCFSLGASPCRGGSRAAPTDTRTSRLFLH